MIPLRVSTPAKEGLFQASKWLHFQVLLDEKEMAHLLDELGLFSIHIVSTLVESAHGGVSKEEFLNEYALYTHSLKRGEEPDEKRCRPYFSSIFTKDPNALYAMQTGEKYLIKPLLPILQLQLHHVFFSSVDGKFYPKVHGADSISWGIQFSYPQIFQDPKSGEYNKVDTSETFPNTPLFTTLTKWVRKNTLPTPFVMNGQKTNLPIRLGKECFSWIAGHPHLQRKGITVPQRDHYDV